MSVSNLEKLRLTLNPGDADERQFDIYPLQTIDISSRKSAVSISPPDLPAYQNILLGISGQQADISIDCQLWADGADRSNGTAPTSTVVGIDEAGADITYTFDGTVTSVEDQAVYLEHVIHASDFDATWRLDHLTGNAFQDNQVFVETVDPTVISQQQPKWKPCRLSLRRGGSVG
jgi:hypothetical protein